MQLMKVKSAVRDYGVPMLVMGAAMTAASIAGTDKTFDTAYQSVKAWSQGSLGKILALGAFLVGLGIGMARQSLIAVVIGIAFALVLFYGPTIIESIMTAAV